MTNVKGIAELMRKIRGFTVAFAKLKARCPECNSEQIQLLRQLPFIKAEDIDKPNPPEYAVCRCRIRTCKHRFLVGMER